MSLTDTACRNAKAEEKPRKLADGGGLYLLVNKPGKHWRADYRHCKRPRNNQCSMRRLHLDGGHDRLATRSLDIGSD